VGGVGELGHIIATALDDIPTLDDPHVSLSVPILYRMPPNDNEFFNPDCTSLLFTFLFPSRAPDPALCACFKLPQPADPRRPTL